MVRKQSTPSRRLLPGQNVLEAAASNVKEVERAEDATYSHLIEGSTNWSENDVPVADICLINVICNLGFDKATSRVRLRVGVRGVPPTSSSFGFRKHYIQGDSLVCELVHVAEESDVLASGELDGPANAMASLAYLVKRRLVRVTLAPSVPAVVGLCGANAAAPLSLRVWLTEEAFAGSPPPHDPGLLDNRPQFAYLKELLGWLRPDLHAGEGAVSDSGEAPPTEAPRSLFDPSDVYSAVKPTGKEPMCTAEFPALAAKLRPYQRRAVAWMLRREGATFDVSEADPGTQQVPVLLRARDEPSAAMRVAGRVNGASGSGGGSAAGSNCPLDGIFDDTLEGALEAASGSDVADGSAGVGETCDLEVEAGTLSSLVGEVKGGHPLWQSVAAVDGSGSFYYNPYSGQVSRTGFAAPPDFTGGILADEMGLGKTVEVLALILAHRASTHKPRPPLTSATPPRRVDRLVGTDGRAGLGDVDMNDHPLAANAWGELARGKGSSKLVRGNRNGGGEPGRGDGAAAGLDDSRVNTVGVEKEFVRDTVTAVSKREESVHMGCDGRTYANDSEEVEKMDTRDDVTVTVRGDATVATKGDTTVTGRGDEEDDVACDERADLGDIAREVDGRLAARRGMGERVDCACGAQADDEDYFGLWVQCDACLGWNHGLCVGMGMTPKKRAGRKSKGVGGSQKKSKKSGADLPPSGGGGGRGGRTGLSSAPSPAGAAEGVSSSGATGGGDDNIIIFGSQPLLEGGCVPDDQRRLRCGDSDAFDAASRADSAMDAVKQGEGVLGGGLNPGRLRIDQGTLTGAGAQGGERRGEEGLTGEEAKGSRDGGNDEEDEEDGDDGDDDGAVFLCGECARISAGTYVQGVTGASLIVCPATILHQWREEIQRHSVPGALRVVVYEGVQWTKRAVVSVADLASADVVLTTYDVLRADLHHDVAGDDEGGGEAAERYSFRFVKRFKVVPSPLTRLRWWRVCLDEAQMVESGAARATEMALRLHTVHRWCVTGTPIERGLDDLFGLVRFLRCAPFNHQTWWSRVLQEPYLSATSSLAAKQRLLSFLRRVMWRTSKADVAAELALPPQSSLTTGLRFSAVEEYFYRKQHEECVAASRHLLREFTRQRDESTGPHHEGYSSQQQGHPVPGSQDNPVLLTGPDGMRGHLAHPGPSEAAIQAGKAAAARATAITGGAATTTTATATGVAPGGLFNDSGTPLSGRNASLLAGAAASSSSVPASASSTTAASRPAASAAGASLATSTAAPTMPAALTAAPASSAGVAASISLRRLMTPSEIGRLLAPLVRLRQACCHPQVGSAGIRSLHRQRAPMTMDEILDVLVNKARIEAEETQRLMVSAMHGTAALMILEGRLADAAAVYREALRCIEGHAAEFRADPLQQLHAMHSLWELLSGKAMPSHGHGGDPSVSQPTSGITQPASGIPPTLRDAELPRQMAAIRDKYLADSRSKLAQTQAELVAASKEIAECSSRLKKMGAGWFTHVLAEVLARRPDGGADVIERLRQHIDYAETEGLGTHFRNATSITRRFRDARGLAFLLAEEVEAAWTAREALLSSLWSKTKEGEDPSPLEVELAGNCRACRWGPETAPVCSHCEMDQQFQSLENRLFSVRSQAAVGGAAVTADEAAQAQLRSRLERGPGDPTRPGSGRPGSSTGRGQGGGLGGGATWDPVLRRGGRRGLANGAGTWTGEEAEEGGEGGAAVGDTGGGFIGSSRATTRNATGTGVVNRAVTTWAPSECEVALRFLQRDLARWRATWEKEQQEGEGGEGGGRERGVWPLAGALEAAKAHVAMLEGMRREFVKARLFASAQRHLLYALDELAMATMRIRLRLPGEEVEEYEKNFKVCAEDIPALNVGFSSDKLANESKLEACKGQLRYLKNLAEQRKAAIAAATAAAEASAAASQSLPPGTVTDASSAAEAATALQECPVCRDLPSGGEVAVLPCGHFLCTRCCLAIIDRSVSSTCQLAAQHINCPTCRARAHTLNISYATVSGRPSAFGVHNGGRVPTSTVAEAPAGAPGKPAAGRQVGGDRPGTQHAGSQCGSMDGGEGAHALSESASTGTGVPGAGGSSNGGGEGGGSCRMKGVAGDDGVTDASHVVLSDIPALEGSEHEGLVEEEIEVKGSYGTKLEAVVRRLLWIHARDPTSKSLVFSQWQDVLELLGHALEANGICFDRVKTKASLFKCISNFKASSRSSSASNCDDASRGRVEAATSSSPSVQVLLLPLQHAGQGLNLVEAQHVVLVEPILNPGLEMQAINRVHRIGQTRKTFVHRFIVRNTIEERVYELSRHKATRGHAGLGMGGLKKGAEDMGLTVDDISELLSKGPIPL
eukprot:jgi/Mesvir1/17191/Mv07612-RA.1